MRYGLIGCPLGHSYSKEIHEFLGNKEYTVHELKADELDRFMTERDFSGINVTIPYKTAVLPYLDKISASARRIGSVNTVVNKNGKLYGYNTDYFGFAYMTKCAGISLKGKKTVILGSGGTSKTAQAVARDSGAAVAVISRSQYPTYNNIEDFSDAEVLINATPVGMFPSNGDSPVELDVFRNLSGVIDVIYNPDITELMFEAEERGIRNIGGIYMLAAQAAQAHRLFTGEDAEDKIQQVAQAVRNSLRNIVLIGMPGAGKSTVAETLGVLTGRCVIDTDKEIEKSLGKTCAEIIERNGETFFRREESKVLRFAGKQSGAVISCGGGAVLSSENRRLIKQNGITVLIKRETESLSTAGRPLSVNLEALEKERMPIYESVADITVSNNRKKEETAEEILRSILFL